MRRSEKRSRFLLVTSAAGLALAFAAAPLAADWIKTREGALVETRGGWEVRGKIVVFTAANGTLSSLRLSEVDLDASAVATFEAKARAEAPAPEPEVVREPVLELTNADIPRAGSVIEVDGDGGEPAEEAESPAQAPGRSQTVKVISWQPVENPETGGLELRGALQNQGENIASNLRLLVRLYDDGGELLGSANAFLEELSLAPSSSVKFRALFPDVNETSVTPEFEIESSAIQLEAVLTDSTDEDNES